MIDQHDRPMFYPKCFKTGIHDGSMQWIQVIALAAGNTQAQWHMGNGTGASGTWAGLATNGRGPWPQQKHGRGGGRHHGQPVGAMVAATRATGPHTHTRHTRTRQPHTRAPG